MNFKNKKKNKKKKIEKKNKQKGYTNKVYSINNNYILKITDVENEKSFQKEPIFYKHFENLLPVPKVIVYDDSKKLIKNNFLIYHKIKGDNLYSKWHLFDNQTRREIIKQLSQILKQIDEMKIDEEISKKLDLDLSLNWHDKMLQLIQSTISKIEIEKLLPENLLNKIKLYVNENHHLLREEKMGMVSFFFFCNQF